jgi:hypothetical protein
VFLLPYAHVALRTRLTKDEVAQAIVPLLDGPPDWLAYAALEIPGHRLRGTVEGDEVRLIVMRKPWRRTGYLPVATGTLARVGEETVLSLTFRPRWFDVLFLPAWSVLALSSGAPLWLGAVAPLVLHAVGCLVGFEPAVERVVRLLEARLQSARHS